MNPQDVSDEMLMAYVDGEAGTDAVEQAAARNPALARRLREFQETRRLAQEAFSAVAARSVPETLVRAVLDSPAGHTRAWPMATARLLPLAAAIALVAGIGGYLAAGAYKSVPLLAPDNAVTAALENASTGVQQTARSGRISVLGTFRLQDRICRTFEFERPQRTIKGIGCHDPSGWTIEFAVAGGVPGLHTPASDQATQSLDAFLDSAGAEGPLDETAERELQAHHWQGTR